MNRAARRQAEKQARRAPPKVQPARRIVVPQMFEGHDIIVSVREAVRVIRAQFAGSTEVCDRQNLADLNMVWQQCTKVHERTGLTAPTRAEIMAGQNVLARLNADGEITLPEFNDTIRVLERGIAAVRRVADPAIWQDVELTMSIKHEIHGATDELWFGGVLQPERKAA